MTQTSNRFFDEIGRLMNDAAGDAQGVKREVDAVMLNQAVRILRDLDIDIDIRMPVPHQEHHLTQSVGDVFALHDRLRHPRKAGEFVAVKEMARLAREENEALKARIAELEARVGSGSN